MYFLGCSIDPLLTESCAEVASTGLGNSLSVYERQAGTRLDSKVPQMDLRGFDERSSKAVLFESQDDLVEDPHQHNNP